MNTFVRWLACVITQRLRVGMVLGFLLPFAGLGEEIPKGIALVGGYASKILDVSRPYQVVGNPFSAAFGSGSRIEFNNGEFVAWGGGPAFRVSTNGTDWRVVNTELSNISTVFRASFGYLVFGTDAAGLSAAQKSQDGIRWEARISDKLQGLRSVAEGSSKLVAAGAKGLLLTSEDGLDWIAISAGTSGDFNEVVWGNGKFVVSGATVLASVDGVKWEVSSEQNLAHVTYGAGKFVAVPLGGDYRTAPRSYVSQDGLAWRYGDLSSMTNFTQLFYGGGRFVLFEGVGFLLSDDGQTWMTYSTGEPFWYYGDRRYAYGNGVYVTSSSAGLGSGATLRDATQIVYPPNSKPLAVTCGPGGFVAVGQSGIGASSPDGVAWTTFYTSVRSNLYMVTYQGGEYLAIGEGRILLRSSDGGTWSERHVSGLGNIVGMAAGQGRVVLIDPNGAITTIDNAGEHRFVPLPGALFWSISYGNGQFVVLTYRDSFVSPDGLTWTRLPGRRGYSVAFGNGQFLAGDINGELSRSTDGLSWEPLSNPWSGSTNLLQPFFQSGQFVIRMSDSIFLSLDGQAWRQVSLGNTNAVSVAIGAGRVVQLDSSPSISYSTFPIAGLKGPIVMGIDENGLGVILQIRSDQGFPVTTEMSPDLRTWIPLAAQTNRTGVLEIPVAPGAAKGFYRAKYGG